MANDPTKPTTKVRSRFAPSPTGEMHIGSLRTALFAFLYARKHSGQFILRIEDTDRARFVEGGIERIISTLEQVGLNYDEGVVVENGKISNRGSLGPYLQSERKEIYKQYAEQLVASNEAYYCFCDEKRLAELRKEQEALKKPTMYDRKCRYLNKEEIEQNFEDGKTAVIRQAIPLEGKTIVDDQVYKQIVYDNKILDDQILMKSDGFPTYHLAVVVDDHLMEITDVIRGEEWLPSTPKHILLYQSFEWQPPHFAHLPLLLNKDRSKLSKRQGDVSVSDYISKGYLQDALLNFVALLGWNPKTDKEIFSLTELIEEFDFSKVNKSGAVLDIDKLDWLNSIYIRALPTEKLAEMCRGYLFAARLIEQIGQGSYKAKNGKTMNDDFLVSVVKLERERLKKLSEIAERVSYFFSAPQYSGEILIWRKSNVEQTRKALSGLINLLKDAADEDFAESTQAEQLIKQFIAENGFDNGTVLWPLRVALSGLEASPGPFEILPVLFKGYGKFEILQRLETALRALD